MNSSAQIFSFLESQTQENLRIDEAEGKLDRERSGYDQPLLRERIYGQVLQWAKNESMGTLRGDFAKLEDSELNEDTLSTAIATFTTSLLPAVRRIYNKLIAMDLVSVQPISGPAGIIYWIDHLFGTSGGGATEGQRVDEYRHNAYGTSSEKGTIRDINFRLESKTVTSIIKKIKGEWTLEAEQDLRSQWNMDLESELMPIVTNEIIREIDGTIIADLIAGVSYNVNWNSNGYRTSDENITLYRKEYEKTIYDAILEANNEILKAKKVNATYIIMHPTNYLRIQKLESFKANPLVIGGAGSMGRYLAGTVGGDMFKVYVDPEFPTETQILLGVRANTWQYATAYFSPFIPLFTSAKYMINDDFSQMAKGAMTRFAHGIIPEYKTGDYSTKNKGLASVTVVSS